MSGSEAGSSNNNRGLNPSAQGKLGEQTVNRSVNRGLNPSAQGTLGQRTSDDHISFGKGPVGIGTGIGTLLGGASGGLSIVLGFGADLLDKAFGNKDIVSIDVPTRRAGGLRSRPQTPSLGGDGGNNSLGKQSVASKPVVSDSEDDTTPVAAITRRTKRGRSSTILGGRS